MRLTFRLQAFRMFRRVFLAATLLLFTLPCVIAQHSLSRSALAQVPVLELPRQNNDSLLARERINRRPGRPETFAVTLPVDLRPATAGAWSASGTLDRWHLRIHSPGARSLNLGFRRFHLPAGAALYLSTPEARYGPFTADDNADHAEFWSPVLAGDELVVEVEVPRGLRDKLDLAVSSVNHDFEGVLDLLSAPCHLDVACGGADGYPEVDPYRQVIRSVAAYTVGGVDRCTGFLVNNTNQDGRPLFLTANHCGVDADDAASLVAYWNYENDRCRTPGSDASGRPGNGRLDVFNTGARVLAASSATDMTLLELDEPVNPRANAYFAGWSAEAELPVGSVAIVHHPNLDEKRISFSDQPVTISDVAGEPTATGGFLRVPSWTIGSTETGSSGAPLFDAAARVRGQLFGGRARCGNEAEDIFGWLARSWTGGGTPDSRLSDWLDPCQTGLRVQDGLAAAALAGRLVSESGCGVTCSSTTTEFRLRLGEDFPLSTRISVVDDAGLTVRAPARADGGSSFTVEVAPGSAAAGTYTVRLAAAGGNLSDVLELHLTLVAGVPAAVTLLQPENNSGGIDPFLQLGWAPLEGATDYDLQFALAPDFAAPVVDVRGQPGTEYVPDYPLAGNTTYYWRVRARNACGSGDWSAPRTFTTADRTCLLRRSGSLPVPINEVEPGESVAEVILTEDVDPAFLEVIVGIEHTFIGDLRVELVNPAGTVITLIDPPGGGACAATDLYVVFAGDAELSAANFSEGCFDGNAENYRRVQPVGDLSAFAESSTRGTWQLRVTDEAAADGGAITDFRLRICADRTDNRDLTVELISGPILACANAGGSARLRLGADYTDAVSLRVEADDLPLDNYSFTFDADSRMLDVSFSAWTLAGTGRHELSLVALANDGTERRAVTTLTVLPLPTPVVPLPARVAEDVIDFRWQYSSVADAYALQLASTGDFADTLMTITTTGRQVTLPRADLPDSFHWRVVASNSCGTFPGPARDIGRDTVNATYVLEAGNRLAIYPNPTQDLLTLEWTADRGAAALHATLFTAAGRQVADWSELRGGRQQLSLGAFPDGVYYLRVTSAFGGLTERILLLR
ncbi:proprotein convertase P-domain-containing protein [Lewinella sp. IMCC34183]|uniref:proprotein convertase P-domain-containing protein n=1 Tax=Lewinella sp. IMCC34183 TaxID=2248762 RepID=UPI000E2228AC|nr:proprotein convertase P-domain-containing protein [Lewinella sp. IMCC34183]